MAWIIGLKPTSGSSGTFVEHISRYPDCTISDLYYVIPINYGGTSADYSYFQISSDSSNKIQKGWQYSIMWGGGIISAVDFTNEISKPWVKLSSDKSFIANDGIDSTVITLEVWKPNLSGIATTIQRTDFRVTILTPDGEVYVRINIVNGVGIKTFKTTKPGPYIFPSNSDRYGTMRIFNQLRIDVDEVSLLS